MFAAGLYGLTGEVLLFAALGLAVGGLDDLLVDLVYIVRSLWRSVAIYARHPRMTTQTLPVSPMTGPIAIFVPAWREAEVIGAMLRYSVSQWGAANYRIFVGVYPNDPDTREAVASVAASTDRLTIAINDAPGPTTKADCLNRLWRAMQAWEQDAGVPFKAIVLHDAEHVVPVVNRLATQFRVGQQIWSNTALT